MNSNANTRLARGGKAVYGAGPFAEREGKL